MTIFRHNHSRGRIYTLACNHFFRSYYILLHYLEKNFIKKDLPNGKGKVTYMDDGSIITFRTTTKSDSYPSVDINISKSTDSGGIKQQKVYFGKKDDK